MRNYGLLGVVLLLVACGDLTNVPAPPVPLSVIAVRPVTGPGEIVLPTTPDSVLLLRAAPAEALLTVHLPDMAGTAARFKQTALYELLNSPELAGALGPLGVSMDMLSASGNGAGSAAGPMQMLNVLEGEVVVSVEEIEIRDKNRPPNVRMVAAIGVRGHEKEAEMLLSMLADFAAADRSVQVETGVTGGSEFVRVVGKVPLAYVLEGAVHADALIFGLGRETVVDAIARLDDEDLPSLTATPAFRRGMERCADSKDTLRLHLNVAAILQLFTGHLPADAVTVFESLDLDNVRSLTTTLRLTGRDIVTSTLIDSPGGEDLISRLLGSGQADPGMCSLMPEDATSFTLAALDGESILRELRLSLPEATRRRMEDWIQERSDEGFDLEREVFKAFGPELAIVTLPQGVGEERGIDAVWNHFLGTALVVRVVDDSLASRVLGNLPGTRPGLTRTETRLGDDAVVTYHFDDGQLPPEFALSFARKDGYLYVALSEDALGRLLAPSSPLATQVFENTLKDLPETAAMVSYDDVGHGLALMNEAFLDGLANSLPGAGAPQGLLPSDLQPLFDNLDPAVSYTVVDKRGLFTRTRSPTGGVGSVGGLAGLASLGSIAIPNLSSTRIRSNEKTTLLTLRAIRSAQRTYRKNLMRDADGDREGEFGFLLDLMGKARPGDKGRRYGTALVNGLQRNQQGDHQSSGYIFRVYLPAEDGSPIGGNETATRVALVDGDLAESVAFTMAWPVIQGRTGQRSFLLTPDGVIYACTNGPYGGDQPPSPDVLLSQKGNLASSPMSEDRQPRDGCSWVKLSD